MFKHIPRISVIFLMDDNPHFTCEVPEEDIKIFIKTMPVIGERVKITYGGNPFENIYGFVNDIFRIYDFEHKKWNIFIKLSHTNCK